MGFNLASFFRELEALLNSATTPEDIEKIKTEVAWWKQYAQDCGQLK